MKHVPVKLPKGVTMNEKLWRRFSVTEREGTQFCGLDGDRLLFAVPNTTEMGEPVQFRFLSMREYGTVDMRKLFYIGKVFNGGFYIFQEVA